jgi:hypothetical protein
LIEGDDDQLELTESQDQEGIRAAGRYERSAKKFEETGKANVKAQEAEGALDGPEAETLKTAEQMAKDEEKVRMRLEIVRHRVF